MTLIYKIYYDDWRIRIFGKEFVKNNGDNYKLIINNKEEELKEYYYISDNKRILKIRLKEVKLINDMSYMFYECNQLISLSDILKWNINMELLINGKIYY